MKPLAWLVAMAAIGGLAYWLWSWQRRWTERQRASEERFANFMAQAISPDLAVLAKQQLLLEAAHKAGEAGEPVLSIQLYARLLSRYPGSSYAGQARAAVETQKKKLAKS